MDAYTAAEEAYKKGYDDCRRRMEEQYGEPAPDGGWFCIVRWCNEDIQNALRDYGFNTGAENVYLIRNELEFNDNPAGMEEKMIAAGWDYIESVIQQNKSELEKENER